MIECIKVKVGHQLLFDVINGFTERFNKLVEVFFVKKNFEALVGIIVPLLAFGDGEKVIVGPGGFHVEEICPSFSCPYLFREYRIRSVAFLFVLHWVEFSSCLSASQIYRIPIRISKHELNQMMKQVDDKWFS